MSSPFQQFINQLSAADLDKLASGELSIGADDQNYRLTEPDEKLLFEATQQNIKQCLHQQQTIILKQLYKTQALCKAEFNYQARQLFDQHGAENFCQHQNNTNQLALMIDKEKLIAIGKNDARHQYAYYYSNDEALGKKEACEQVRQWLDSGMAYDDYRVKTHCMYLCS
ncbi:MAG: hypothetical protein OEY11_14085 [Gammaproteobacteria bacterium]|nr:hypothetical protein [Gammaproteobacteria bacterium]